MSQDVVSDGLNKIMNAKKAGKDKIVITKHSSLLLSVLAIARLKGYIINYKTEDRLLKVEIGNIHDCNAIKPRFIVGAKDIEKYMKRYLPAKGIGMLVISTSKGLMTHSTAMEKNMGGSLIAYFY